MITKNETILLELLHSCWNQAWVLRERYDEIVKPKGLDYEEINEFHYKKWVLSKESIIFPKTTEQLKPKYCDQCGNHLSQKHEFTCMLWRVDQ